MDLLDKNEGRPRGAFFLRIPKTHEPQVFCFHAF